VLPIILKIVKFETADLTAWVMPKIVQNDCTNKADYFIVVDIDRLLKKEFRVGYNLFLL
jgi:hypothetical protein